MEKHGQCFNGNWKPCGKSGPCCDRNEKTALCWVVALVVKNPPANARHERCQFDPWVRKIPWRRKRQPTPVSLPGKFHGQRSPPGYYSLAESGTLLTEHTHNTYHATGQHRLILDSIMEYFFLWGAGSLWSVWQLHYELKLQRKWRATGRGPIHPPEFTLANYPARMEKRHGAEGPREHLVIISASNLWAPEGIPEEFGHPGRLHCLFEPHPCSWSLQLTCCGSQMKEKWREIFVNDFLGRVLETLRAGNKEHIEASLELASGNPALTMHSVSYCCCTVLKSCLFLCKPNGLQLTRLLFVWNSPGKKTGVGYLSLLQGIFSIQESSPGLYIAGRFFIVWTTPEASGRGRVEWIGRVGLTYIHYRG